MSGKRYTNEFRIEAVEQLTGRGCSVPDVAQRLGIATHGLYAWKAKFEKPDVVRQTEGAGTASRSVETQAGTWRHMHSDQGSQFFSDDWQSFLKARHMLPGMGRRGNFHDNAVAENFFSALMTERIKRRLYPNRGTVSTDGFDYIEMLYNQIRRYGSACDLSPVELQQRYATNGSRVSMKRWRPTRPEIHLQLFQLNYVSEFRNARQLCGRHKRIALTTET